MKPYCEPCEHCHHHSNHPYRLECVIVCRDYDDFLRHTLPTNKQLFDRLVVVTSTTDIKTQKLCEFYHVECVRSKALDGPDFKKGVAINEGLAKLSKTDWVLHLDADIWLPPQTRILLQRAQLCEKMIYGCDRFDVIGARQWDDFLKRPKLQHENNAYIHLSNAFPVSTRVMSGECGYVPIGFFQLWNPSKSGRSVYPTDSTNAGRTDMMFAKQWPRSQRGFLPEIVAYHLESHDAREMGANWFGRKTAKFEIHKPWYARLREYVSSWF